MADTNKIKFSTEPDEDGLNWRFSGTFTMTAVFGGIQFKVHPEHANLYCQDAKVILKHWHPKPGQLVIDGGCGPGTWTLASLAMGAHVIAFDPKQEALDLLVHQLQLNDFSNEVQVIKLGLWRQNGEVGFNGNALMNFETWMETRGSGPLPEVRVGSLDEMFESCNQQIDWINLDVEGAELQVLRGARRILVRDKPNLVIEIHNELRDLALIEEELKDYDIERDGVFLIAKGK